MRVSKTPESLPYPLGTPRSPTSLSGPNWEDQSAESPIKLSGGGRWSDYIRNQAQLERKIGGLKCDRKITR